MDNERIHTPYSIPPVSAPNHKLQKPSKESGIFWSLVTINLNVLSLKGNIKPPLNTLLRTPLMLLCKNYGDPIIFDTPTTYDLIQGMAREIGSKRCCYNLYFMKCVFLTGKCYAFVHLTDQKNHLHTSDFAYTVACVSNKSGAIGLQHSSNSFFSLRQHLSAHTHTNKSMLCRITH